MSKYFNLVEDFPYISFTEEAEELSGKEFLLRLEQFLVVHLYSSGVIPEMGDSGRARFSTHDHPGSSLAIPRPIVGKSLFAGLVYTPVEEDYRYDPYEHYNIFLQEEEIDNESNS